MIWLIEVDSLNEALSVRMCLLIMFGWERLFASQTREQRCNRKVRRRRNAGIPGGALEKSLVKLQVHSGGRRHRSLGFHGICVSGLFIIHGHAWVPHQRCIPTAYRWDFKGAPQPNKQSYALCKWSHVRKLCHVFFFVFFFLCSELMRLNLSSEWCHLRDTQSMRSERFYPARAFPFYGAAPHSAWAPHWR